MLADDLTGALASAARLHQRGIPTSVCWDLRASRTQATAVVVDMRTRDWGHDPHRRARQWASALHERGCRRFELRIDSTLRGDTAAALQGLREGAKLDEALAVAVPAFPGAGRITRAGVQYAPDALASLRAQHVAPAVFGSQPCGLVRLITVEQGPAAVTADLGRHADDGLRVVVADATSDLHLQVLADGVREFERRRESAVVTLSPGAWLAHHPAPGTRGFVVVAVGTDASPTRDQARHLSAMGAAHVPAARAEAAPLPESPPRILLVTSDRADEAARAVRVLLDRLGTTGCRGVVVTGGHTASCLVSELRAESIAPIRELAPLMPHGVISGGPFRDLSIVTKGGLIGAPDALERAVNHLFEEETECSTPRAR